MPVFLFVFTVLSRLPFASRFLYHSDSGQFALAFTEYDISLHQPHPPGYFLYVMLGKLAYLCIGDANASLVALSIFFSGLTVVTIHVLGKELFDEWTGTLAALLALTSPNFWFHGEVALTYSVEAFFSALAGLCCWRAYRGKRGYLWFSVAVLAIAGGFRQNTLVFLLPLWLFSVRRAPLRRKLYAIALGGTITLLWFAPMLYMSGGPETYLQAFRELWLFNTGHNSVFEKGLANLRLFSQTLSSFVFYSLGAALPIIFLGIYVIVRNRNISRLKCTESAFICWWALPSILFYLLIFIHPANPGYVLILLPPLTLISSRTISFLGDELLRLSGKVFHKALAVTILLINCYLFLFSPLVVARVEILMHDKTLDNLCTKLRSFDPNSTVLFNGPYIFYSYRHLMVYLPEYTVYQAQAMTSVTGYKRKLFGGCMGKTFLSDKVYLPAESTKFAAVVLDGPKTVSLSPKHFSVERISPNIRIIAGPIERTCELFPELRPQWEGRQ